MSETNKSIVQYYQQLASKYKNWLSEINKYQDTIPTLVVDGEELPSHLFPNVDIGFTEFVTPGDPENPTRYCVLEEAQTLLGRQILETLDYDLADPVDITPYTEEDNLLNYRMGIYYEQQGTWYEESSSWGHPWTDTGNIKPFYNWVSFTVTEICGHFGLNPDDFATKDEITIYLYSHPDESGKRWNFNRVKTKKDYTGWNRGTKYSQAYTDNSEIKYSNWTPYTYARDNYILNIDYRQLAGGDEVDFESYDENIYSKYAPPYITPRNDGTSLDEHFREDPRMPIKQLNEYIGKHRTVKYYYKWGGWIYWAKEERDEFWHNISMLGWHMRYKEEPENPFSPLIEEYIEDKPINNRIIDILLDIDVVASL